MTSAINPANPAHGNPTTESVRDNFAIAAQEISNLQTQVAGLMLNMPYLPLSGATMTGPLTLVGEPTADEQAATKRYVDLLQATLGNFVPVAGGTMTGNLLVSDLPGGIAHGVGLYPNGGYVSVWETDAAKFAGIDFSHFGAPSGSRIWYANAHPDGTFRVQAVSDDYSVMQAEVTFQRDGSITVPGILPPGTDTQQLATTAFVQAELVALRAEVAELRAALKNPPA